MWFGDGGTLNVGCKSFLSLSKQRHQHNGQTCFLIATYFLKLDYEYSNIRNLIPQTHMYTKTSPIKNV